MTARTEAVDNGARLIAVLQHELEDDDLQPWHRDVYQQIIGYVIDTTAISVEMAQEIATIVGILRPLVPPDQLAQIERLL